MQGLTGTGKGLGGRVQQLEGRGRILALAWGTDSSDRGCIMWFAALKPVA